jgi:hypothetical protein
MTRLSSKKKAPLQAQLSIRDLMDRAKGHIEAGESHMHQAADDVAAAHKLGATQREIAKAVNKSVGWVNGLLQWRQGGYQETAFGPAVKASRERAAMFSQTEQATPEQAEFEQVDVLKLALGDAVNAFLPKKNPKAAAVEKRMTVQEIAGQLKEATPIADANAAPTITARPLDDFDIKIRQLKQLTFGFWGFCPPYDAANDDPDEDNSVAAYNEELDKLAAELTTIQTIVSDALLLLQQRRVHDIANDKKAESSVEVASEDATAIAAEASKAA